MNRLPGMGRIPAAKFDSRSPAYCGGFGTSVLFVTTTVSFVMPNDPLPLTELLPLAEPRMLTSAPSFVETDTEDEDEALPVSIVASSPVPPC